MNKSILLTAFLLCGHAFGANCFDVLPDSEKIVLESRVEFHQRFDFTIDDLHRPAKRDSDQFSNFRQWVTKFTSTNQRDLLNLQLEGLEQTKVDEQNWVWVSNSKSRHRALLNGEIGKLGSVSCFVRVLFDMQMERFPQMSYPSELMAFLLRHKSNPRSYRVYFSIGDGKTFDVSPPQNQKIWDMVINDLSSGWELFAHLHSHPFMIKYDKAPHVGGTVYPSDEDVQSYQYWNSHGLKEAWITNGFDLIRFNSEDVGKLANTIPSHAPYQGEGDTGTSREK